jgi:ABC-type multidrug transport system ATPase subunit
MSTDSTREEQEARLREALQRVNKEQEAEAQRSGSTIQNPTSKIQHPESSIQNPASLLSFTTNNLSKRFNREWIFRGLNFTFEPGNTYAITGPNGSGKSTLLQVLWGQMPPSAGDIQYKKGDASIAPEEVFHHLSIATPYMDLVEEFTLTEHLKFHFSLKKSRGGMSIDEMIERMYLTAARNKFIANFSSGMRQRVKLAIAFFTEANTIFLDEPGTNLDVQAFDWYLKQLHALPAEVMVLIASNQPAEYPDKAQKIDIREYK